MFRPPCDRRAPQVPFQIRDTRKECYPEMYEARATVKGPIDRVPQAKKFWMALLLLPKGSD